MEDRPAAPVRFERMPRAKADHADVDPIPPWLTGGILLATYAGLFWAERRFPLRRQTEPAAARDGRNLAMAGLSAVALSLLQAPIVDPLARAVERRRWGLLKRLDLPAWLEIPLAVALMDYSLYVWHVWTHRGPLWRFHQVHHVDLDMDASTALRFHFGEMAASIPYRAAQVALIGVGPRAFAIWQTFLMLCIGFHHANIRLPSGVERWIAPILVTPRNHGVHHSLIEAETNSNWSSGLSIWDRLHGTARPAGGHEITVGVPAYRDREELTLWPLLTMPFRRQRPSWRPRRRALTPEGGDQLHPTLRPVSEDHRL